MLTWMWLRVVLGMFAYFDEDQALCPWDSCPTYMSPNSGFWTKRYWSHALLLAVVYEVISQIWYHLSLTANFAGKVILITGGGSGIGKRMAVAFSSLQATVVIWDIQEDFLANTVAEVPSPTANISPLRL